MDSSPSSSSTPTPPRTTVAPKTENLSRPPLRHHRVRSTILIVAAVLVVVIGTGGWLAYRAISVINTRKLDNSNGKLSFFQQLTHIVSASTDQIQGEADDRINMLLLGIGGPGHEGPYLTDTMIVVSYKPSTDQLSLLSIPRDLVVNIPGYDYRKINNVLSFGRDQKYPGGGEALTVKVVSDLLDIPIQYYGLIDFKGFQDVIDRVGGVDVTVDTAFSDYQFPDSHFGYQTIRFAKGPQHMNGVTALNFARSRHGTNGEGSDFARAARQQKIIEALKSKLLSFGTIANPKKISDILGSLGSHSQTNMEVWEMLRLAKLAGGVERDHIVNKVLEDSPTGLLRSATGLGGAYILVPRDNTYADIKFLAKNIFLANQAQHEQAHILVVNATNFPNLAQSTAKSLQDFGLDVVRTVTIPDATLGQTVTITTQASQTPATAAFLNLYKHGHGSITLDQWQSQTGDTTLANVLAQPVTVNVNLPTNIGLGNVNATATVTPNLVLILGQDQPKTAAVSVVPNFPPRSQPPVVKPVTNKQKTS